MGYLRHCFLILPLLLLSGCFEYSEEVWVNRDDSARLETDKGYLAALFTEDDLEQAREDFRATARELAQYEGVTKAEFRDFREEEMHHFVFDIHVKHYRTLEDLMGSSDYARVFATGASGSEGIRFEELGKGKKVRYLRVLDSARMEGLRAKFAKRIKARLQENGTLDSVGEFDPENPFKDKYATYTFHAPKLFDVNDPGSLDGKTVTWRFPLDPDAEDAVEVPAALQADFTFSTFSWVWWLVALLVLAVTIPWFRSVWRRGLLRRFLSKTKVL